MAKVTIKMNKSVERAIEKSAPKTLKEAGRYTWRIARSLIKHRSNPNKSSAKGTPPHSHKSSTNKGFKKTIVYGMMPGGKSVLIGPMLVRGGLSNIARVHEFGGSQIVREQVPELTDGVNIGDKAPVSEKYISRRKDSIIRKDPNVDPRTGRTVYWIRIRTRTQQAHSNRLYRRMNRKYGKFVRANYPARPYMKPALDLSRPKLSSFWRNSVKM